MKLYSLVPNFYIYVSGSDLYSRSYLESLFFLYCVRKLLAQPQELREGQGTAPMQWLASVHCPPLELVVHGDCRLASTAMYIPLNYCNAW